MKTYYVATPIREVKIDELEDGKYYDCRVKVMLPSERPHRLLELRYCGAGKFIDDETKARWYSHEIVSINLPFVPAKGKEEIIETIHRLSQDFFDKQIAYKKYKSDLTESLDSYALSNLPKESGKEVEDLRLAYKAGYYQDPIHGKYGSQDENLKFENFIKQHCSLPPNISKESEAVDMLNWASNEGWSFVNGLWINSEINDNNQSSLTPFEFYQLFLKEKQ
ncbi:MAG: hypothetical protein V4721_10490 [Bacteroidota bacterium]